MKNIRTIIVSALVILCFSALAKQAEASDVQQVDTAQLTAGTAIETDNRVQTLRAFLHAYNSPLEGEAKTFVTEADRNNIDWKLVVAIAGTESTFGQNIPKGSFNAWGWGVCTGTDDGVHFKDWSDGIVQVSKGLRTNYFDHGAKNLNDIGWIYAANGDSWATHVQFFIDKINAFIPTDPHYLNVTI